MNCMTYSSSNSLFFFEPLIAYQYQLKNSNFTSVFLRLLVMLIQELKEINDKFLNTFSSTFEK